MSVTNSPDRAGRSSAGRKLIAVMYADMVGYSRLIGLDDVGTLERLRALRGTVIDPAINEHGGRIIHSTGDSLLIVFDSVDGAVRCAISIQQRVSVCDGNPPPDRAIRFRVGIDVGDVISDGADIHGDVVNVAARLQAECPPGGICVSQMVREHTYLRPDLSFEELGALKLKNINRPVEAFTLRLDAAAINREQGAPGNLAFGRYEIDPHRQELRREGQVIHVEPQVYDLLVHLVHNRGRVVSKDELLERIWNGRIVSDAALSSRINAARKAIGDSGDRQALIKTVHRRGFRFVGVVQEGRDEPTARPADGQQDSAPPRADGKQMVALGKPSIVVLPLVNLSQEVDTDYFSYGLTEDIIRLLARNRWLDVLSRHSAVPFQGKGTDPREIGAVLGIRYLVQGTVVKYSERVRIAVDLISTDTGHHLWSESYDVALADVLEVQRAMAQQIAAVIEPELARLEREAAARRPPVNLGAWDCYQRGLWHLWGFTKPGLAEGEAMFRRAIELDSTFARAHGALAYVTLQSLVLRDPSERPALLEDALRHGRRAVALDDQDCMNLCVVGRVLCFKHEYEDAAAYLEEAIRINPSFAQAYFALGFTLIVSGRPGEAIPYLERATNLSPRDPHLASFYAMHALAYLSLDQLDVAEVYARRTTRAPNTNQWPFAILASVLGLMGRTQDARRAVDGLLERYPGYTVATARSDFFFCGDHDLIECHLDGLRRAGIPETAHAAN